MEMTIKNKTCYYFEDVISTNDLDLDQIVVKDINDSICDIDYAGYYGFKPSITITFNEVEKVTNKDGYLKLYGSKTFGYI